MGIYATYILAGVGRGCERGNLLLTRYPNRVEGFLDLFLEGDGIAMKKIDITGRQFIDCITNLFPEEDALYFVRGDFPSDKEFIRVIREAVTGEDFRGLVFEPGKTQWRNLELIESNLETLATRHGWNAWCDMFYRNLTPPSWTCLRAPKAV